MSNGVTAKTRSRAAGDGGTPPSYCDDHRCPWCGAVMYAYRSMYPIRGRCGSCCKKSRLVDGSYRRLVDGRIDTRSHEELVFDDIAEGGARSVRELSDRTGVDFETVSELANGHEWFVIVGDDVHIASLVGAESGV